MLFCPVLSNKKVKAEFDELVDAIGENGAYYVWNKNNGEFLDRAPNGAQSKLFSELLRYNKGDRKQTIRDMLVAYTPSFLSEYGDWLNNAVSEPNIWDVFNAKMFSKKDGPEKNPFYFIEASNEYAGADNVFGKTAYSVLMNGESVSSRDILANMIRSKILSPSESVLARILSVHNIPVKFGTLDRMSIAEINFSKTKDGYSIEITIDPVKAAKSSAGYVAQAILHEVIHGITEHAIKYAKNTVERRFARANHVMWKTFSQLFPEEQYGRGELDQRYYAFTDEFEFASEFATNPSVREIVYKKAAEMSDKGQHGLLGKIKQYWHSLVSLLTGKQYSNSMTDQVKEYEKLLHEYIRNHDEIKKGSVSFTKIHDKVNIDAQSHDRLYDTMKWFRRHEKMFQKRAKIIAPGQNQNATVPDSLNNNIRYRFEKIADMLSKRAVAIRVSQLPDEKKTRMQQVLAAQVENFRNDARNTFDTIANFLLQVMPQLTEDVKYVSRVDAQKQDIAADLYMYYTHDNFGVYSKIAGEISSILNNTTLRDLIEQAVPESQNKRDKSAVADYQSLKQAADVIASLANDGDSIMKTIMFRIVNNTLLNVANKVNDPTMINYLQNLLYTNDDQSIFLRMFGSADRANDHTLRAIEYLTSQALDRADMMTNTRTTSLNRLQAKLRPGEQLLCYERNRKGEFTGYLQRDRNFGQFYQDYDEFMVKLNRKYGLEDDNRKQPNDSSIREKWANERNAWLNKHCHRKFKAEYYDAYAKVSETALSMQRELRTQIVALENECIGQDGFLHYEKLNAQQYNQLQYLKICLRNLYSDYDLSGNEKQPGDLMYDVAKELQQLREDLSKLNGPDEQFDSDRDVEAWSKAREAVIQRCGGVEEMKKGRANKRFDWKTLDKWDSRNTKTRLKMNASGTKALLFEKIENQIGKPDYGAEYDRITEEINGILASYKNFVTGEYAASAMPADVKNKINKLVRTRSSVARLAKKRNPNLAKQAKLYATMINKFANTEHTYEYDQLLKQAMDQDVQLGIDMYEAVLLSTGTYIDPDGIEFVPYKYYTKFVIKPEYADEFAEMLPGEGWRSKKEKSSMLDPEFDESYHESMVPKMYDENGKVLYKNEDYGQINGNLKVYYDAIHKTIEEACEMYGGNYNTYRIPAISGTLYSKLKNSADKLTAAQQWVKDHIMVNEDDLDYGQNIADRIEEHDATGHVTKSANFSGYESAYGERPDGRQLNIIPRRYVGKAKDPSRISSDLTGIVLMMYNSATRYAERTKIASECEVLLDMLEVRDVYTSRRSSKNDKKTENKSEKKAHAESDTYKMARAFMDMNMYDIRQKGNGQNAIGKVSMNKIGRLIKNYSVALNLGMNPRVGHTGLFTTICSSLVQAITGFRYSLRDYTGATNEVMMRLVFQGYGGLKHMASRTASDKLSVAARHFNAADAAGRARKNTNRSAAVNLVANNALFGFMTQADIIAKYILMVTVLRSYRFVNGHFTTKTDEIINNERNGERVRSRRSVAKEFNDGETLWSVIQVDDYGNLTVKKGYEEAFKEIEPIVRSRIIRWGAEADGVATETQRAAITQSFVGGCVLQHRTYLPLMLQDRFGKTVYNYDTQTWEGGTFLNVLQLIIGPIQDLFKAGSIAKKIGYGSAAAISYLVPYFLTGSVGVGLIPLLAYSTHKIKNKSGYDENGIPYYFYQRQLRQLVTEAWLNLGLIPVLATMLSAHANADDDDKFWLQYAAYIARAVQWETSNPYNLGDIANNFKSVSAVFSASDGLLSLMDKVSLAILPRANLFNTFVSPQLDDDTQSYSVFDPVERGAYKYLPEGINSRFTRTLIKTTPFKNIYEQTFDPAAKRRYYENQIMRLNKN